MSYIINKTDGSVLTEVVDGTIDQTSTDITLVGKNSTSYGELFNENFVKMLENFANTSQPNNPIKGQLWYDTSEGRLKVYDGNGFKVSGGTIVSNVVPSSIAQGDIWIDSFRKQLYFNDGNSTILAGPAYTSQQGQSGFIIGDIIDTNEINHTVAYLYVAQTLIGIYSKDAFTPLSSIPGFSGSIGVGFNTANHTGIQSNIPTTRAYSLVADDLTLKTAEDFVSTTNDSSMTGTLAIANSIPLILGPNQSNEIRSSSASFDIYSQSSNQNFSLRLLNGSGTKASIFVNSQNEQVGLYTDSPTATLDVNGDLRVRGNLTVEGETTTINTTNIAVEDLLIELGKVASPSNSTANGGGILLEGGTDGDKTLTWENSSTSWRSSENFKLNSGKTYRIGNSEVLSETSLGLSVTSALGLNAIGTLNSLQTANLGFTNSTISYVGIAADGNIVLAPKGAGTVNVSNKKISNLADPASDTDAVNRQTLVNRVQTAPVGLSINVGTLSDAQIITKIINYVYPAAEHQNGAICRVWCIDLGNTVKVFTVSAGIWTFTSNITVS